MKYILMAVMISMISCKITGNDNRWKFYTPRIWQMQKNIPQGSDTYSSAFRAGCNDGISTSGYGGHRLHEWTWDGFKQSYDVDRSLENAEYKTAYNEGYYYCGGAANSIIGF